MRVGIVSCQLESQDSDLCYNLESDVIRTNWEFSGDCGGRRIQDFILLITSVRQSKCSAWPPSLCESLPATAGGERPGLGSRRRGYYDEIECFRSRSVSIRNGCGSVSWLYEVLPSPVEDEENQCAILPRRKTREVSGFRSHRLSCGPSD